MLMLFSHPLGKSSSSKNTLILTMTDQTPQSSTPSATPNLEGLNSEIGKAFKEVEAAENKAVSIENRIRSIKGVSKNLMPKRKYGQPINSENIGMTLASMIEANDPELGAYLNISTGYWRKKEEEKAARAMQIEAMKMATEKLKKQNDDSRKRVEWEATTGVSSLTGRRFGQ